jgi:3-oxoacyl-[acyl-carrier protein] reductase
MEVFMDNVSYKKVAIVTGGSRGIGYSIVKKLSENNYNVVFTYNNSMDSANQLLEECKNDNFGHVCAFKADISDYSQVKSLIDFTLKEFGKIDLLVNNAAIDLIKPFNDVSNEEFDTLMKTNLYFAFYTSKLAVDSMLHEKSGSIINISSIWGLIGASCEMPYSVSKAGLDAMTKSLAKELGPSNIRVNSIAPGIIDTDMNAILSQDEKNDIIKEIPLAKIGSPSDIADCVIYLANAQYITGQIIQVNGGWNI